MTVKPKYELRNTEADEVLRPISKWIGRWGFITLLACLAILFLLSKMIRLPDIRKTPVVLHCEQYTGKLYALAGIRQEEVQGIMPGNEVLIDISGWNAAQYGSLKGYVDSIYTGQPTADGLQFMARIQLPQRDVTSKNVAIGYSCGLKGNGRIVVQKRSLFEAVFGKK